MKRAQVHLKKIELDLLGLGAIAPNKLLPPISATRQFKNKHHLQNNTNHSKERRATPAAASS
jgi:hypothetical protein